MIALTLANSRQSGALHADQPVTADNFNNWISPDKPADWNAIVQRAVGYLNAKTAPSSVTSRLTGLDVTG